MLHYNSVLLTHRLNACRQMEGDEYIFRGKTFDSKHDLCEAVKKFRDNFTNFLIETSKKQEITFPCKRGGKECKSKSKGIRPAQHYNNLGCPAMIRCYRSIAKNATGYYRLTTLIIMFWTKNCGSWKM